VKFDHLGIVHAVEVIACQNQHILRTAGTDLPDLFANRISRALVPVGVFDGLLCRPDLHPPAMEVVKIVGTGDVPVQGDRKKLGQNGYFKDA